MATLPRKTRQAWNEAGHAHFLTYSCFKRLPLLTKDRTRGWIIDAMAATRRRFDLALWAYVIMPEHVHIVLQPRRSNYRIEHILASLKRSVAKQAKDHLVQTNNHEWLDRLTVRYPGRVVFRFWQTGGGFDRNIWKEKLLFEIMDYTHANPVRRGLANTPVDWYWSSARFWEGDRSGPLEMDPVDV